MPVIMGSSARGVPRFSSGYMGGIVPNLTTTVRSTLPVESSRVKVKAKAPATAEELAKVATRPLKLTRVGLVAL